jgi:hypothetical protein
VLTPLEVSLAPKSASPKDLGEATSNGVDLIEQQMYLLYRSLISRALEDKENETGCAKENFLRLFGMQNKISEQKNSGTMRKKNA